MNSEVYPGQSQEELSKNLEKNGKYKITLVIVFILISTISRYFRSKHKEKLPTEITPGGTVQSHPRSPRAPQVYHRMKPSSQTLVESLIFR
jgi:hypothetical protein